MWALASKEVWPDREMAGFCEIEPFPQAVLRKHYPNVPIYEDIKPYQGFAGIIYSMMKSLNTNKQFATKHSADNYSLLLVAKDDPYAIKLEIKNGQITFTPLNNTPAKVSEAKKECDGAIITSKPTFLGLGVGKVKAVRAILSGRLKIKGMKYVRKFTQYFALVDT